MIIAFHKNKPPKKVWHGEGKKISIKQIKKTVTKAKMTGRMWLHCDTKGDF